MQYPSGWNKDLNVSSPDVVTFYPSAVNSNASLTVTVDNISDEKGIPLAQYASDSNDAIKHRTQDFRLVESSTNNTLAGLPAYRSIYTYAAQNNSTVQGMEIGAIKGDNAYIFTYEAGPNEYYTYLPMIKNMIYSIQLTSQISPQGNAPNYSYGHDWMSLCNKISFALIPSCNTLVNPDNTLTPQGIHARDCIQNGAVLAGGALLLGTPPTTIISVLPFAAKLFGCGDVVDFSKLTLGTLSGLGSIFR